MHEKEVMPSQVPDQGLSFVVVRDHIGGIVAKWKNAPAAVNVVTGQSDLPGHIQTCILPGQTVKGAFDPQANAIHLVSTNLESIEEAEAALIHEAIGHFGVEAILGGSARRYYTDVARLYGRQGLRDVAEEYGLDLNDPGDILTAAKEKVAYLAMSAKSRSGVLSRLVGETRDALRRIGFTLRLNETDIRTMIGRAEKLVKNGKHSISLNGNPIHPLNGISAFRKWFKKSRAVTEDGNPMVVYRGTQFAHTKNPESLGRVTQRFGVSGAIFTTDNPRMASSYAAKPDYAYEYMPEDMAREAREEMDSMSPGVFPLYCSLQNPLEVDRGNGPLGNMQELVNRARASGHDGLIVRNVKDSAPDGPMEFYGESGTLYIVFSQEQVKSVFDPAFLVSERPDVRVPETADAESKFREWFAGSKIVNEYGEPLVVYHGTEAGTDFSEFSTDGVPYTEDDDEETINTGSGHDPSAFVGAHFAKETKVASGFAEGTGAAWMENRVVKGGGDAGPRVFPVYLKIEHPARFDGDAAFQEFLYSQDIGSNSWVDCVLEEDERGIDEAGEEYDFNLAFRREVNRKANHRASNSDDDNNEVARDLAYAARRELQKEGCDGIEYENTVEGGTSYVVFDPTQIKSAIGNSGMFDPSVPDIRFLYGDENARGYGQAHPGGRENDPQSNPEFLRWFGPSKVTDGDGKPLVVYHGTSSDFTKFERGDGRFYRDTKGAIFFTTSAEVAESYLPSRFYTDDGETVKKWYAPGSSLMPVYLSVRNPMVVEYFGGGYREGELKGYIQDAKKNGHDGIFFLNIADVGIGSTGRPKVAHTIVVFNPKQIKSVYNSGRFSTKTADIRFLYGGKNAKGYGQAQAKFCSLYDQKERFEINDSPAILKPLKTRQDGTVDAYLALGDVLHHPELYRHYPALKNLDVHIGIAPNLVATGRFTAFEDRSAEGLFDIQPGLLIEAPDVKSAMELLIHEVQHSLQAKEGFAMGGNPGEFRMTPAERESWLYDREYWYAVRAIKTTARNENLSLEEAAKILKREGDYKVSDTAIDDARIHTFASIQGELGFIEQALKKSYGFASYQCTAGEIEARDAATRTGLDASRRRAVAPYSSENISPKEAIVQFGQSQDGRASRGADKQRDRRRSARNAMSPS